MDMKQQILQEVIRPQVTIGGQEYFTAKLPRLMTLQEKLGLVTGAGLSGQVIHRNEYGGLWEMRATVTPGGDYLLMFPDGLSNTSVERDGYIRNSHYTRKTVQVNKLLAYRSLDKGQSWTGPIIPFDIDYNQHGFIPLIPRGGTRIYALGTQPIWDMWSLEKGGENAPIGYRYSDDDGHYWSEVRVIRPRNDPGFRGMAVMRMAETDRGTWLLAAHDADFSCRSTETRQYLLRSEDQGLNWDVLPGPRNGGWYCRCFNRLEEGRVIALGDGDVYMQMRSPSGCLWDTRSSDDGNNWSEPQATTLIHPEAPPMLFHLSDGKTLAAFHHNSRIINDWSVPRAELWVAFSEDEGHSWGEPRFVLVNALTNTESDNYYNYQCSYLDMFVDNGICNLFLPHRWRRALHLQISEPDLRQLPTREELR